MYKIKVEKVFIGLFFVAFLLFLNACSKDQLMVSENDCAEDVVYTGEIREIINNSCAYSGCHDGSGAAPGNYRTYVSMQPQLTSGRFGARTLDTHDMPPSYAPSDRPSSLTLEQLDLLNCWKENAFKE